MEIQGNNIEAYVPSEPGRFRLSVVVGIGEKGSGGSNMFYMHVCSLSWIDEEISKRSRLFSRSTLILMAYNRQVIIDEIRRIVQTCQSNTWDGSVENLRRYFDWEYDNYTS